MGARSSGAGTPRGGAARRGGGAVTVIVGGVAVEVERRPVRRLNLRVRADGSAHLSVPARLPDEEARRFLAEHADWLRDRVERVAARRGERAGDGLVPLWGRLAPLPDGSSPSDLWRAELERRLPEVAARMGEALGVSAPGWQLRSMTSRWGSCTPATKRVRINVALAAYPPTCLDYVVAHELTHLLEPSHGARFHALLARAYPDERAARALLRQDPRALAQSGRAACAGAPSTDSFPTGNEVATGPG